MNTTTIKRSNDRNMTNVFLGYNHNPVISEGEFYDTKNLTTDYYPLMGARKTRKSVLGSNGVWEELVKPIVTKNAAEIVSNRHYYDYYAGLGASFSESRRAIVELVEGFELNYAEVYAEKTVTSPTGQRHKEKFPIKRCNRKLDDLGGMRGIAYENTIVESPSDIVLHIYGYYEDVNEDKPSVEHERRSGAVRGLVIKNDIVSYFVKQTLIYGGEAYDFSSHIIPGTDVDVNTEVNMISLGAFILIFPLNLYFNTITKEMGNLAIKTDSIAASYKICDGYGRSINPVVAQVAPENPSDKDYWIDSSQIPNALYQYSKDLLMWVPVASTYMLVTAENAFTAFSEGDAIYMANCPIESVKSGSVIRKKVDNSNVVISGLVSTPVLGVATTFERKVPKMDYVCVSNNRVFGCYYGITENGIVNEIYACKLGDPKNWYVYDGIATDSYALSLGDDGEFTGAATYNGYPLFFKQNVIYKIYGNYPAAYQLYTYDCRGCQKGSARSIQIVGEYLMYKSVREICVFDGENPVAISDVLGLEQYDNASAGVSISKYYVSMRNKETGIYSQFVYDMQKGLWMKEDDIEVKQYAASKSGTLYGHNKDMIYAFEYDDEYLGEAEQFVEWEGVIGSYNYNTPDKTYLERVTVRADIPVTSEINVDINIDDGEYKSIKTIRGQGHVESFSVPIQAKRCDHYKIRLSGHGDVKIYSITRTWGQGSELNGSNHR